MSTHLLCRVIITILHPIYRLWLKPRVKCKTSKPRRHMELLHDAGHLYRRLAPTCQATQSIETSRKLLANLGKLSKNHFASTSVKGWCMSPHGITGPLGQIPGTSFEWPVPNVAKFRCTLTKSVRDIRCGKNYGCCRKSSHYVTRFISNR